MKHGRNKQTGGLKMITKKQLKDWLNFSERVKVLEEMESYVDETIKNEVLSGRTTFEIHTVIGNSLWGSRKTPFYFMWYSEKLSEDNLICVRKRLLEMYSNHGFLVKVINSNYGKGRDYDTLKFTNVENALDE